MSRPKIKSMSPAKSAEHFQLPWYDSQWLSCYHQAKHIVELYYPDRLKEFEQSFDILRTDLDFTARKTPSQLSKNQISEFRQLIKEIPSEQLERHELLNFGRFVVHNHPVFNQLQLELVDQISAFAGQAVEPSYNFLALYNNLGYCQPHMDAPNAKWTLDICLEQSQIWPIYFSQIQPWPEGFETGEQPWQKSILDNPDNRFTEYSMVEGEALFFSGSSQWHYRPRIAQKARQNFCNLLFLHYIPKGTGELVNPNLWAELFSMPELDHISFQTEEIGG